MNKNRINILNRKAKFEYEFLDKYTAGIKLVGTEIKAIREGKAGIAESFCEFHNNGELFVINMNIEEYSHATYFNHSPKSERKLLLNKQELAKLDIALARGKKLYDKRETIKDRDNKRALDRIKKDYK